MIKYIYSVFLGLLIAIFVGVGISVFYQQPTQPKFPSDISYSQKEPSEEQLAKEKQYNVAMDEWNEKMKPYNRNVSIMALIAAVVLVAIGLAMGDRAKIIADGIMFGGVFTLLYSLIRGFMSSNTKYSFLVVTVALITVIALGYMKLIKPHETVSGTED